MKVTVEIDCTPLEAREFFGLPDVAPLQAAVLDAMRDKMVGEIGKLSPESIIQSWLSVMPLTAEKTQELFANMFSRAFGAGKS